MSIDIWLEDVQHRQRVEPAGETVRSTLAALRMPHTMFQAYLVRPEDDVSLIPSWTRLDALDGEDGYVLLRAVRNTLFDTVLPPESVPGERLIAGVGVDQVVPSDDGSTAYARRAVLDAPAAQRLVQNEVVSFMEQSGTAERGCIFGVSGGGDSNALAYGLRAGLPQERLFAFTIVFRDVMTQAAADRATVLCQELGIHHEVIQPDELSALLGIATSVDELYADFSEVFGSEALHFFGTFLILKTARTLASRRGCSDLAFGYNREDLLAEMLFQLVNGRRPLAYPTRPIGDERIVMPVWRIPKLVLDACHPKFSLENYRERDANTTRQRSLAFYLGHSLDSAYPSLGLSLLDGFQKAYGDEPSQLRYDSDLDVYVTELADENRRSVVADLLHRHFRAVNG